MRKNTLAAVIASVLLGTLTAQADPSSTEVGSETSNVDKDSSSGEYYPYSAGTVGDDPAEPTSTAVSPETGDDVLGPTDQWGRADADGDGYLSQAELTKAAPNLSASFSAMDVDGDDKLTRGEFRTWRESREARLDADQGAHPPLAESAPSSSATEREGSR